MAHTQTADPPFFQFTEAAPNPILIVDGRGVIAKSNMLASQLFGYDGDDLAGLSVDELVPDRFRPGHADHRERYDADREPRPMGRGRDLWGRRRDGTEFPLEIGLRPTEHDGTAYVLAVIVDITERKAIEAALRTSEERFRQLFDFTPIGLLVFDEIGTILMANRALEQIHGAGSGDLVGQSIAELVPDDRRDDMPILEGSGIPDSPASTTSWVEQYGLRADGTLVPVEYNFETFALDGSGVVVAAIVDITERKEMEAALAARTTELERSNEELETFAYVASHDLRAPLRGINNLSRLLEVDLEESLTEETRENMQLLRARVQRMEGLLDGLLEYSRAGRGDARPRVVDTNELVRGIGDLLALAPPCVLTIDGELPTVRTDKALLQQVLANLISNAHKHHDRAEQHISVAALDRGDHYQFLVTDDGPGIAPEAQEAAFEMFRTLRPRDEVEGSGMGLAIVDKVVTQQGGNVHIESEGRGTTLGFDWPKGPDGDLP